MLEYDELQGIQWTWQAMDGAMTKAPLGGEATGKNPTDRAKLGTKRSILTDGAGVPLGIVVSGANTPDMKLVETTLDSIPVERPTPTATDPQNLCLDKGYDYPQVRELVNADQCLAAEEPYDVVKRTRVLIDHRRSPDQVLIPGPTPTEVGDGQRHVCHTREFGHDDLL